MNIKYVCQGVHKPYTTWLYRGKGSKNNIYIKMLSHTNTARYTFFKLKYQKISRPGFLLQSRNDKSETPTADCFRMLDEYLPLDFRFIRHLD